MPDPVLALAVRAHLAGRRLARRSLARTVDRRGERGEGVVSAALVVMLFAFLAALMWVVFRDMFTAAASRTKGQADLIGQ